MNGDAASTTEVLSVADDASFDADVVLEPIGPAAKSRAAVVWERIEPILVYAGDWLNPILVKETRQALKSFQFTTTFALVLAACWIVTIGGLALIGPSIFYSASGGTLLAWYYAILAFPLIVVVPYSAFRSLTAEREDNTYDLLSITSLRPRQIISGKLGSSIVQMAVYFSAVTPCLAFTYLLRGVDLPTIAVLTVYTFFGSLGLSMAGILLATLSEQRFAQVFVSVALVAGLLWICFWSVFGGYQVIQFSYAFMGGEEFWTTTLALTTAYVTTFTLMFFAAAGTITFSTENRSTPLRLCMLVQQAAWIGWMAFAWIYNGYELGFIFALAAFAAVYWYVMGALLTSERVGMSQRVKRRLPQSFFGRAFLSWLNPGPASGYMFTIANGTSIVLISLLGIAMSQLLASGTPGSLSADELFCLLIVGWGYVVAYLGVGMMAIRLLRRFAVVNTFAAVLIHFLVILAGSGIPTTIQMMSVDLRYEDYSLLQIPNPFWSLTHLVDGGVASEGAILVLVIPAAALCILLLNLRSVVRELQAVRIAPPKRVLQDEAELHPPPAALPQNPWDEPE
ncbi:MAG: hypothetical protein L0228_14580 [Planctomycetes bacterium]|nr:hypothetical protein [Planctomycetota bacterium]